MVGELPVRAREISTVNNVMYTVQMSTMAIVATTSAMSCGHTHVPCTNSNTYTYYTAQTCVVNTSHIIIHNIVHAYTYVRSPKSKVEIYDIDYFVGCLFVFLALTKVDPCTCTYYAYVQCSAQWRSKHELHEFTSIGGLRCCIERA